jgi:hypothetical protein
MLIELSPYNALQFLQLTITLFLPNEFDAIIATNCFL